MAAQASLRVMVVVSNLARGRPNELGRTFEIAILMSYKIAGHMYAISGFRPTVC